MNMNLVIHGNTPYRILVGDVGNEAFKSCQENREHIVDEGITDVVRFANLMADPAHTKTPYAETAEGIANALASKEIEEREWRNSELERFDAIINTKEDIAVSAAAERAFRVVLRDYPQQVGFPDNARPVFV
jgi:hypothetical protein